MKNLIIKILLVVLLLIVGGYALDKLMTEVPGYVLIAINKTTLEMNLWMAVLTLIVLLIALYWGVKLLRLSWRLTRPALGIRSSESAAKLANRGMLAYMRGEHDKAQRWLLRSAKKSPMPLVNLLAAADSAQALGDTGKALGFLDKAKPDFGEQSVTMALARAEIFRRANNQEARLETLLEANQQHPNSVMVQDRLCDTYMELGSWAEVREMLPRLRPQLPKDRWRELQGKLVIADLKALQTQQANEEPSEASRKLQMFWLEQASRIQQIPQVCAEYARSLIIVGDSKEAESTVRKFLRSSWHKDMVLYYGLMDSADSVAQLSHAEGWLKRHPKDAILLLTLARLSMRNHLWDKAKGYYQKSIEAGPTREAYSELARLLTSLGEHQTSGLVYRDALRLDNTDAPELPMPPMAAAKSESNEEAQPEAAEQHEENAEQAAVKS
ncbi:heme biosynthesis HemY N-terminal domain-containing protein [Halioxenophilus aromaticivorans]|uniref:Heme biosynthesis protein HemY n=1 Tax=Halioxenophilus aromaticivorans TaxID=1306992 RepID=A0AAV3U561_9ALTE